MPLIIEPARWTAGFPKIVPLAFLISSILAGTINACPLELPTAAVSINGHRLVVELAATPLSRACGLSKRSALDENQGMLFVYPRSDLRTFWMKDTWIPLSIAFLDDSGTIINIEIMSPDQTGKKYRSRIAALYALEVNQGWFRLHGITVGDQVDLKEAGIIGGLN
jgi:uncharacterized protein